MYDQMENQTAVVTIEVTWPSKSCKRKLPEKLCFLGKTFLNGTYRHIANAAWKVPNQKKALCDLFLRDIEKVFPQRKTLPS